MRNPNTVLRRWTALLRARTSARSGVEIGPGTRFGRRVRCRASGGGRIVIGARVEIAPDCSLLAGPGARLEVGDDVFIGGGCLIAAMGLVTIGDESMLAESVTIRDHDHDPTMPPRDGVMLQRDVVVGRRVWVGAKASVGRGVVIGNDVVVGAHAFVNRSLPAGGLAVGVPARVVKEKIKRTSGVD